MKRNTIITTGLAAVTALLLIAPISEAHRRCAKPKAVRVVIAPRPAPVVRATFTVRSEWVAGHWAWRGPTAGYRWVPGHWVRR